MSAAFRSFSTKSIIQYQEHGVDYIASLMEGDQTKK